MVVLTTIRIPLEIFFNMLSVQHQVSCKLVRSERNNILMKIEMIIYIMHSTWVGKDHHKQDCRRTIITVFFSMVVIHFDKGWFIPYCTLLIAC
jgi:hypothetical protein